ncbi:MAG: DUF1987 domain-containing protein [Bacteroidetes bacterium]|nr:DUF1987 domain-containing protein [Bacteroidota bacterium]
MQNLQVFKTKYTLEVDCSVDTGVIKMSGSSYPENAIEFFQPLFDWLEIYISEIGKEIILDLKLNYLNTSSSKCILDIMDILENYQKSNGKVQINWYYEEDDEDILETGEEFAEDTKLKFNLISYQVSKE